MINTSEATRDWPTKYGTLREITEEDKIFENHNQENKTLLRLKNTTHKRQHWTGLMTKKEIIAIRNVHEEQGTVIQKAKGNERCLKAMGGE